MGIIGYFKSLPLVTKVTVTYLFMGFFQKSLALLSGPFFTRILTQEEYGFMAIFNSWFDILGIIAMLSLSSGIYNNGLNYYEKKRDEYTLSMLALSNLTTIVVFGIVFLFRSELTRFINISFDLISLMFFSYFFSPAFLFWTTRKRYEYQYKRVVIATIFFALFMSFVPMVVSYFSQFDKVYYKIWSEKIVLIVFNIIFYVLIFYKAKYKIRIFYWREALCFSIPLVFHYLSIYLLNSLDRIMIEDFFGKEKAAIYTVSYSAAFVISIVWQSVNAVILPQTYECLKKNQYIKINDICVLFLKIYGAVCIVSALMAPEIFILLAPQSYGQGIYIFPLLIIGVFLTGVYCLFANIEFYYKSTRFIMLASMIATVLNFILNMFFLPRFGYTVAAYTTILSFFIQTILHYLNYAKLVKVYNVKSIIKITLTVIASCSVIEKLYVYNGFIRYFLALILLAIFMYKANYMKKTYCSLFDKKM